ncbi:MAG: pyridoxamine 5'-phosphate oxidase family protein [Acidimicrobiia bacterium]|nr:pyridoxamine 5'-phosphate oxidase family protein [Acidimicrobiia bacterium]
MRATFANTLSSGRHHLDADRALRYIDRRSYAVIASTSEAGRSHSAGVLYARSGPQLYFSTTRSTRKARNIAANPHVGVTIPVRRVPVGPPSAIMFQARAELVAPDDPALLERVATGDLKAITGHGELELPDGVFVRITLPRRLHTYGLGMSLLSLIRDPLNASGAVDLSGSFHEIRA